MTTERAPEGGRPEEGRPPAASRRARQLRELQRGLGSGADPERYRALLAEHLAEFPDDADELPGRL